MGKFFDAFEVHHWLAWGTDTLLQFTDKTQAPLDKILEDADFEAIEFTDGADAEIVLDRRTCVGSDAGKSMTHRHGEACHNRNHLTLKVDGSAVLRQPNTTFDGSNETNGKVTLNGDCCVSGADIITGGDWCRHHHWWRWCRLG